MHCFVKIESSPTESTIRRLQNDGCERKFRIGVRKRNSIIKRFSLLSKIHVILKIEHF